MKQNRGIVTKIGRESGHEPRQQRPAGNGASWNKDQIGIGLRFCFRCGGFRSGSPAHLAHLETGEAADGNILAKVAGSPG